MEELKFEAPLAQFESEDWVDLCSDLDSLCDLKLNNGHFQYPSRKGLENLKQFLDEDNNDLSSSVSGSGGTNGLGLGARASTTNHPLGVNFNNEASNFTGSLEDLVNTFDDKITKCFRNYDETTDKLAPVQMRSQEELMNDCQ